MAQVVGGTTHDFAWDRKHDLALRILRHAADACAAAGARAVAIDNVLAVLVNMFGDDLVDYHRDPEEWARRGAQELPAELQRLKPDLSASDATNIARQLDAEAKLAADEWALGNPEKPATADLLNVVEHILFKHRVTRNPPRHRAPVSLQASA